jgi:hypothetical protein
MAVTDAEGRTEALPVPAMGMEARMALPTILTGGEAPSGMTSAWRPRSSVVVEETVCAASVMPRPEPGAEPMARIGATDGSVAAPAPVMVRSLEPSSPMR